METDIILYLFFCSKILFSVCEKIIGACNASWMHMGLGPHGKPVIGTHKHSLLVTHPIPNFDQLFVTIATGY